MTAAHNSIIIATMTHGNTDPVIPGLPSKCSVNLIHRRGRKATKRQNDNYDWIHCLKRDTVNRGYFGQILTSNDQHKKLSSLGQLFTKKKWVTNCKVKPIWWTRPATQVKFENLT